jgi:hypothetical protein
METTLIKWLTLSNLTITSIAVTKLEMIPPDNEMEFIVQVDTTSQGWTRRKRLEEFEALDLNVSEVISGWRCVNRVYLFIPQIFIACDV